MTKTYETATEFVLITPEEIRIAEAPDPTAEGYDPSLYKFYNPRGREKGGGFDKEPMEELMDSIIKLGLQQPILARLVQEDGNFNDLHEEQNDTPQLIAGERRLMAITKLKKKKTLVYNKSTHEMEPADEVYETIPVSLLTDCNDETALSLAVDENEQSQPLTPKDQVRLVEDLLAVGLTPNQICDRLNKNPAWVNHTQHFKTSLPEACFGALMAGEITRHVATELLKYKAEDREEIWEEAQAALTGKRGQKREELEGKVEDAAGQVEVTDAEKQLAGQLGLDEEEAANAAAEAEEQLEESMDNLTEFEDEPTTMTGGDITSAGSSTGNKPKTPSAFPKKKIEKHYIDPLRAALGIEVGEEPDETVKFKDSVTGKTFPRHILQCCLDTCEGIVAQDNDVFEVLRELMYDLGKWDRPEATDEEDEIEDDPDAEYEDAEDPDAEYDEDDGAEAAAAEDAEYDEEE
jgi:hypothetical protein